MKLICSASSVVPQRVESQLLRTWELCETLEYSCSPVEGIEYEFRLDAFEFVADPLEWPQIGITTEKAILGGAFDETKDSWSTGLWASFAGQGCSIQVKSTGQVEFGAANASAAWVAVFCLDFNGLIICVSLSTLASFPFLHTALLA